MLKAAAETSPTACLTRKHKKLVISDSESEGGSSPSISADESESLEESKIYEKSRANSDTFSIQAINLIKDGSKQEKVLDGIENVKSSVEEQKD